MPWHREGHPAITAPCAIQVPSALLFGTCETLYASEKQRQQQRTTTLTSSKLNDVLPSRHEAHDDAVQWQEYTTTALAKRKQKLKYRSNECTCASDSMFYPLTLCALQIVFMIMIE